MKNWISSPKPASASSIGETTSLLGHRHRGEQRGNLSTTATRTYCTVIAAALVLLGLTAFLLVNDVSWASALPLWTTSKATSLSAPPPPPPRYTATQFISFTINTMGGNASHGECAGRAVDGNGACYLGNLHNLTADVYHRLAIFEQVLNRIRADQRRRHDDAEIDHGAHVLKIVALPEFYLRGPRGAYSTNDVFENTNNGAVLLQVSDRVRELVSHDTFAHYLFVLGTVIAARSATDPTLPWESSQNLTGDQVLYYNFCPVYKGGHHLPDQGKKYRFLVTKEFISKVDFLNRTTLPNPAMHKVDKYAALPPAFVQTLHDRHVSYEDDNVLEIDNLRIGVEICLDHRRGVLWRKLQARQQDLVDVHLIVSAGMAIERGPNPVKPGGVVYLSDGEASSAACLRTDRDHPFDPELVCRGPPDAIKHLQPYGGTGYSDFFTVSACWDMENSTLLAGYYSLYQTQGCAYTLSLYGIDVMDDFKYYPPSIEIYPVVNLPPPASLSPTSSKKPQKSST